MPKRDNRALPSSARDRGAVAVEFALVLPLLLLLLFGAITGGIAFSNAIGVANAVREGARFAATADVASGSWATDSLTRIRQTQLDDPTGETTVCVQLTGATAVGPVCDGAVAPAGTFQGDIPPAGEGCVVLVWAQRRYNVEAVFQTYEGIIHRESAARYEREC